MDLKKILIATGVILACAVAGAWLVGLSNDPFWQRSLQYF